MSIVITETTDIRRLPIDCKSKLVELLDLNDVWQKLAQVIPNTEKPGVPLYSSGNLNVFRNRGRIGSPSERLLSDWETRGRSRPTVKTLLDCLIKAQLFQAADYIAVDILKGNPAQRPDRGPGARCNFDGDLTDTLVDHLQNINPIYRRATFQSNNNSSRLSSVTTGSEVLRVPDQEGARAHAVSQCGTVEDTVDEDPIDAQNIDGVPHYSYAILWKCTNGFERCLGKGAFGEVYLGQLHVDDAMQQVAVKKLSVNEEDQFLTELRVMAKYKHPNLLPLFGYSSNNPRMCCLISLFMVNGCLEDRLALKNGTPPILWRKRLSISIGTARGIEHLHTFGEDPLVHRDIKSANILLDENFEAKVGDFGIAKIGGDWQRTTMMMTAKISGTCAYMSNEAFRGNVTVKMDTFSFGIVLLELLTGLAPDDPTRENNNLLTHVQEEELSAQEWMDPKAGDWQDDVASGLLRLAFRCTAERKKERPLMKEVLYELEDIYCGRNE